MNDIRLLPSQNQITNLRDIFHQTIDQLARPFPAIPLNDWPFWTKMVGGFRMKEFSILCGPTGKGKTTLLANMSKQLAQQRVKHFVMSIETGPVSYCNQFLSALEGRDLNTGEAIPTAELAKISANHLELISNGDIEFSVYETRVEVEQLKADIRYAVEMLSCKIVFIDNLNFLLRVTRGGDQLMEMDRVIHELIEFVKSIDAHIVMVMHPKKTEGGRVTSEFDIKGSSTSVQEAQNVFLFNPPTPGQIEKNHRGPTDREIFIAKMRRRGKYVGRTILFKCKDSCYSENGYQ